jgi:hypothetical protein
MARRTVRTQRSSPYLIVLVVIISVLFVAAAVGWGWTWSIRNEELANTFGQARLDAASQRENANLFVETRKKYEAPDNTPLLDIIEQKDQLAKDYRSEIPRLVLELSGTSPETEQGANLRQSASNAIKEAEDVLGAASQTLQKSYEGTGAQAGAAKSGEVKPKNTLEAARALTMRLEALIAQVRADAVAATNLQSKIDGLQAENTAVKEEQTRQLAQEKAKFDDEQRRLLADRESAINLSKQLDQKLKEAVDRLMGERKQWLFEREKLDKQILTLNNNLKEITTIQLKMRPVPTETGIDGRIVSVGEEGTVAYGDLGKKDSVILGMTFSIFSRSEIGKEKPQPKAEGRIVKIMEKSCEVRLYNIRSDNPVIPGDILVNPVYDRERRLRFVLIGKIDIEGSGADQSEQLKGLVQKFGGRVEEEVTPPVDYLIVGDEPQVPPQPAAGTSAIEQTQYKVAREQYITYHEAIAKAEQFGIPMLSVNRFLGLMGMVGAGQL